MGRHGVVGPGQRVSDNDTSPAGVLALTVFDDGSGGGPALYAGGSFTTAGGVTVNRIAKWDGTAWSPLGSGMNSGSVWALTVFDDGSSGGPALYAGGTFTMAGGVNANYIAKWDGTAWSALGSGVSDPDPTGVFALTVFDDGSGGGPALYVGGIFTTAGGVPANHIAKWDGTAWSALGSGMDNVVLGFTEFDDDSDDGPALYVGGDFTTAGGVPANRIAKWDGTVWSPLGNGMNGEVHALAVFDDGSGGGSALYAGGVFSTAGTVRAIGIAKWDGTAWSAVGGGVDNRVWSLRVFDDGLGGGPALYVGGLFSKAGGMRANRIAKWGCPSPPCGLGDVNCDGAVDVDDLVAVILGWGACPDCPPPNCPADVNDDCVVNVDDLIIVILNWGP
jgi:trimeric autotransporter adhesin